MPLSEWIKSSESFSNGNCVEVAEGDGLLRGSVLVRDSKDPGGPVLAFTPGRVRRIHRRGAQRGVRPVRPDGVTRQSLHEAPAAGRRSRGLVVPRYAQA